MHATMLFGFVEFGFCVDVFLAEAVPTATVLDDIRTSKTGAPPSQADESEL